MSKPKTNPPFFKLPLKNINLVDFFEKNEKPVDKMKELQQPNSRAVYKGK